MITHKNLTLPPGHPYERGRRQEPMTSRKFFFFNFNVKAEYKVSIIYFVITNYLSVYLLCTMYAFCMFFIYKLNGVEEILIHFYSIDVGKFILTDSIWLLTSKFVVDCDSLSCVIFRVSLFVCRFS